jgi:hypothetical protein
MFIRITRGGVNEEHQLIKIVVFKNETIFLI